MAEPTKAELLEEAQAMGLDVNDSMTKAEIQAAIDTARQNQTDETENPVCVQCGAPATAKTINPAVNSVFYCQQHAQESGEATAAADAVAGVDYD